MFTVQVFTVQMFTVQMFTVQMFTVEWCGSGVTAVLAQTRFKNFTL